MHLHRGNLFLVGLPGAGKSTLGRQLARRLGKTFVDADAELERKLGVTIPTIFEIEGEAVFRDREEAMLVELAALSNIVLATGGGVVIRHANREQLRANGTVIYLHALPAALRERTRRSRHRPLLNTADPAARLAELYAARDALYREVAECVIESDRDEIARFRAAARSGAAQRPRSMTAVRTQQVSLGERSYPIHVGPALLQEAGALLAPLLPRPRAVVVTNPVVAAHWLGPLRASLSGAGIGSEVIVVPDGETHKTWATLHDVLTGLLELKADRSTTVVALGGGVVGDIAGFAAAICQRGMPFVQIPTTLLAQVDSSVGGKTGVNHPLGKNLIGAFYQPRVVLIDTNCLRTLPDRELAAGLAEVIKYGAIRDRAFFDWLEAELPRLVARDAEALIHAVTESCRIKAEIVAADERETGERALLNFGHTFGHAIEAGVGYGEWLHGEAVAAGMVMAAQLSGRLGLLASADVLRLRALLERAGLPVDAPRLGAARYLALMSHDKKVVAGAIRFVLLRRIGDAFVTADVRGARFARGARRLIAAFRSSAIDRMCASPQSRPLRPGKRSNPQERRVATGPPGPGPARRERRPIGRRSCLRCSGRCRSVAGNRCGDALLRRARVAHQQPGVRRCRS